MSSLKYCLLMNLTLCVKKWPYLSSEALNEKTEGTFLNQLLILETFCFWTRKIRWKLSEIWPICHCTQRNLHSSFSFMFSSILLWLWHTLQPPAEPLQHQVFPVTGNTSYWVNNYCYIRYFIIVRRKYSMSLEIFSVIVNTSCDRIYFLSQ